MLYDPCCSARYYSGKLGLVWFNYRVSQASQWVPSVSRTLKVCFRNKTQRWLPESSGGHAHWWGSIMTHLSTSSLLSTETRTVEMERRRQSSEIAQLSEEARPPRGPEPGSDSHEAPASCRRGLSHLIQHMWFIGGNMLNSTTHVSISLYGQSLINTVQLLSRCCWKLHLEGRWITSKTTKRILEVSLLGTQKSDLEWE